MSSERTGRVLITHADTPLGYECSLRYLKAGFEVHGIFPDEQSAQESDKRLSYHLKRSLSGYHIADLSSQKSIRAFSSDFKHRFDSLQILILLSPPMDLPKKRTMNDDQIESIWGSFYISQVLISGLLLPLLTTGGDARIIFESYRPLLEIKRDVINLEDIECRNRRYSAARCMLAAEAAKLQYADYLNNHMKDQDLSVVALSIPTVKQHLPHGSFSSRLKDRFRPSAGSYGKLFYRIGTKRPKGVLSRDGHRSIPLPKVLRDPQNRDRLLERTRSYLL